MVKLTLEDFNKLLRELREKDKRSHELEAELDLLRVGRDASADARLQYPSTPSRVAPCGTR